MKTKFEKTRKILKKSIRFIFLFGFISLNASLYSQKITTEEFLKEHQIDSLAPVTSFDKIIKLYPSKKLIESDISYLKETDSVIILQGEKKYPTIGNLFEIETDKDITFSIISFGKVGFKKTVVFPAIRIFDKNGGQIKDINIITYELKSPLVRNFHHYSEWKIKIQEKGKYYILIAADNSSIEGGAINCIGGYAYGGYLHSVSMVAGVNRGAFGRFKIDLLK
jgi:hypothetical protein